MVMHNRDKPESHKMKCPYCKGQLVTIDVADGDSETYTYYCAYCGDIDSDLAEEYDA